MKKLVKPDQYHRRNNLLKNDLKLNEMDQTFLTKGNISSFNLQKRAN
jgi:hypothetical protein